MKTFVFAFLIITSGCSVLNTEDALDTNPLSDETGLTILNGKTGKQTLQEARNKWNSVSLQNYTYSYTHLAQRGVFGAYNFVVEQNAVTNITNPKNGESVENYYLEYYTQFTIDFLFDYTEDALDKADEVRVKFNQQYGYPVSIYIDYHKKAIDDEEAFQLSGLIK